MAFLICSSQKQGTQELILENPQQSVQKSIEFMQRMLVMSISNIAFFRKIFPDGAFKPRKWEKIRLKILKTVDDLPGTKIMFNWLKSTLSLIESNTLKKVILLIEEENTGKLVEMYTFLFGYNQEAITCYLQKDSEDEELMIQSPGLPQDIRRQVEQLLHSLIAFTSRKPALPDNVEVSMRIELNESARGNFKLPRMFKYDDTVDMKFPLGSQTLKLGKIETKFASFTVTEKSGEIEGENEDVEEEKEVEKENEESGLQKSLPFLSSVSLSGASPFLPTPSYSEALTLKLDAETSKLSASLSNVEMNEKTIVCICKSEDDIGELIKCESCGNHQHKPCYKLLTKQNVARHICVDCHNPADPSKTCTHPALVDEPKQMAKALYRRALDLCLSTVKVSPERLMYRLSMSRNVAMQVFLKLDSDQCLHKGCDNDGFRLVNIEHLKSNVLPLFFNELPNSDEVMFLYESPVNGEPTTEPEDKMRKRPASEKDPCESPVNIEPTTKSDYKKRKSPAAEKDENVADNQQEEVPQKKKRCKAPKIYKNSRKN